MSELNELADTLRRLLEATRDLSVIVEREHTFAYIIDDSDDGKVCGPEIIAASIEAVSPPPSDTGRRVNSYPGVICVSNHKGIPEAVEKLNALRSTFKELYAEINRTPPFVKKAGSALSTLMSEQLGVYPLLSSNSQSLSIGHLTRHFIFVPSATKVNVYKDPLRKRQRVSLKELYEMFEGFSEDRAGLYRRLLSGYEEEDLRFSFDSNQYRYRTNIQTPDGKWVNKALSTPLIIAGDTPSFSIMVKKNVSDIPRQGADSLIPVIKDLNIYAIKK